METARLPFALLLVSATLTARPVEAQSTQQTYTNPSHRWVITYPARWLVDTQNVDYVQLKPSPDLPEGVVGIHAGMVAFRSADEIVDMVVERQSQSGQGIRILSRRNVFLADSVPAVQLDTELGVGTVGRSRRVFALVGGKAYVLDAETYRDAWPVLEPHFTRIIRSFRVPAAR